MLCTAESVDAFIAYMDDKLNPKPKAKKMDLQPAPTNKRVKWIIKYSKKEKKWIKTPVDIFIGTPVVHVKR